MYPQRCACMCTHALVGEGDETRKCVGSNGLDFNPLLIGTPGYF